MENQKATLFGLPQETISLLERQCADYSSRPGEIIYKEGNMEVRRRDIDEHNVYIGKDYFLFQRGVLNDISWTLNTYDLAIKLNAYNPMIIGTLTEKDIPLQKFRAFLARANTKEEAERSLATTAIEVAQQG